MFHVVHSRPIVPDDVICALAHEDVATVHEAMGRIGAMDHTVRPLTQGMKFCGRAITVQCHPADNIMLIKAVSMAQPGDVVVTDMGALRDVAPFGEVLAVECVQKKIAGMVFSCSVRDSAALIRLGLPVFSTGICVRGTAKATLGSVNHPILCGGAVVNPGDVILGDDDGVVVIPHQKAKEALESSVARRNKEAAVMERLRNGESLYDIYGYAATMERLHCSEEN